MRVLLTRPKRDAEALAARLAESGHEAVIAPVIEIVPLPAALPSDAPDAVLLTSAHALGSLGNADRGRLSKVPLYAVGDTTAATARQAGFRDIRAAQGGNAESLRDLVRLTHPRPARLLYLTGRVRKDALADALTSNGHSLTLIETYDARALNWPDVNVQSLREKPPQACLHFSRRSASLALAQIQAHGLDALLGDCAHLCLSADVAGALNSVATRVVVAPTPATDSLLQVLREMTPPN